MWPCRRARAGFGLFTSNSGVRDSKSNLFSLPLLVSRGVDPGEALGTSGNVGGGGGREAEGSLHSVFRPPIYSFKRWEFGLNRERDVQASASSLCADSPYRRPLRLERPGKRLFFFSPFFPFCINGCFPLVSTIRRTSGELWKRRKKNIYILMCGWSECSTGAFYYFRLFK